MNIDWRIGVEPMSALPILEHNMIDVSIVVPAYNEEESIEVLHDLIIASVEPTGLSFEIIFIDDGSKDATFERLVAIAAKDPRVVAVRLRRNYGQTAAMKAGIDLTRGKILVTMDADLQNDPADIPALVGKVREGYDLAVGYRVRRQDKLVTRKLPSKVANWLIGKVTRLPIRDNGCSLKAYRAAVIKNVPLYSDMHRFIPAVSSASGVSVAQLPVRHHARRFGTSKYGLARIYKVLFDLLTLKTILVFARRPLAAFSTASAVAAAFALAVALVAVEHAAIVGADSTVVYSAVAMLLGSLAVFLAAAGTIPALVHLGGAEALRPRRISPRTRSAAFDLTDGA